MSTDHTEGDVSNHAGHDSCCDGLKRILELHRGKTKVCISGRMYGTHATPVAYLAGDWKPIPHDINYRDKETVQLMTCPECQREYDALVPETMQELNKARAQGGSAAGLLMMYAFQP